MDYLHEAGVIDTILNDSDPEHSTKRSWVGPEVSQYYQKRMTTEQLNHIRKMTDDFVEKIESELQGPLWETLRKKSQIVTH